MSNGAKIAIATGDPAGIGPEVSLKAALDPAVRKARHPRDRADRRCGLVG
jgi:1,2-dihydroxy-3,5-cyclohexadiene-1,4-dicarboxylate dehydrogenase